VSGATTALRQAGSSTKGTLEQGGDMLLLTARTIDSAVRPPYIYGTQFLRQCVFLLKHCWLPLMISTVVFGLGAPGLQGGNFLQLFGVLDRLGGLFVIASIREFAPFVTAVVMAGVGGASIVADLGARKIREELDALEVMGVDPIKNLVVPRFLALIVMTAIFDVFALIFGIVGGGIATVVLHGSIDSFISTLLQNASVTDLWGSLIKTGCFGGIIAIVSCYKGMTASGGAAGVGRAVNQSVVIELLVVFAFNVVFTQMLLATHPELTALK
jgi:phospholipid/cholesterol/gamma-HCH transport system permease protein